jgi:glycosyltransferase involved in cell wall biosynthesis
VLRRGSVVSFYNDIVGEGLAGWVARLYRATVFRLTLGLADRVIVVSDYWRDHLLALNPDLAQRLVVIPTGVDLQRFTPGPGGDGKQLLFVGVLDRFHHYKGLDVLLNALRLVDEAFELTVVGDGELRTEYEAQAAHLCLLDKVHFVGRIDDEALADVYAHSDIYILPSDFAPQEGGFTLTALEALASGVPVILAEGAGQVAQEAEAHGAGLRVPAGNASQLADAVRRLLRNESERCRMSIAARAFIETRHSWDQITSDRRAVYLEAAEVARQRRERRRPGR